jgi:hypothetical protein
MKKTVIGVSALVVVIFGGALAWKPPNNSSDVAGWMQAFGAIVAIGLAVWLQYEARTEKEAQAERLAGTLARQVLACLDGLQWSCRRQTWSEYVAIRQLLVATSGIEVPLAELKSEFLSLVLGLRSTTIKAVTDSQDHIANGNWNHFDVIFGNFAQDCRLMMTAAGVTPAVKAFSP